MYNDPYNVLGISPSASDKEVKKAYKELVKKYHPDQYQDNPLSEVAEEKMAEINRAFDEIMDQRRGGGSNFSYNSDYSSHQNSSNNSYSGGSYNSRAYDNMTIRNLIQQGNVTQAEQMLNAVDMSARDAEWHFLMGSICFKRGWLNDAYAQFVTASQMDPNNIEYRSALNQMNKQRSGFMAGDPMNGRYQSTPNGCTTCNCCCDLLCLDSCCECMGGDLIPCC